jgi:hypothetical protein
MKGKALAAALWALAAAAPALAQAGDDDILSKLVNVPAPGAHRVDGGTGRVRGDSTVQGGKALRVEVPGRSQQTWDVAVGSSVTRPVKAGDTLVLAFWARLEKGEGGAATASLPYNAVQLAAAPYTPLFTKPMTIGTEWKMYEARGKADKDYPAGALNVAIHLATAKQTIDIGPVFVLDMGQ